MHIKIDSNKVIESIDNDVERWSLLHNLIRDYCKDKTRDNAIEDIMWLIDKFKPKENTNAKD